MNSMVELVFFIFIFFLGGEGGGGGFSTKKHQPTIGKYTIFIYAPCMESFPTFTIDYF